MGIVKKLEFWDSAAVITYFVTDPVKENEKISNFVPSRIIYERSR